MPHISSYDFWLFGYLKIRLEGIDFNSPVRLLCEVEEIQNEIRMSKWDKAFDEWKVDLRQCIDGGRISRK
jgi:hypothetical protein